MSIRESVLTKNEDALLRIIAKSLSNVFIIILTRSSMLFKPSVYSEEKRQKTIGRSGVDNDFSFEPHLALFMKLQGVYPNYQKQFNYA